MVGCNIERDTGEFDAVSGYCKCEGCSSVGMTQNEGALQPVVPGSIWDQGGTYPPIVDHGDSGGISHLD